MQDQPNAFVAESTEVDYLYLMGWPPFFQQFLSFMHVRAVRHGPLDTPALLTEWMSANDHNGQLEITEGGWADGPPVTPVPAALNAIATEFLAQPFVQRSMAIAPASIGFVELDRLVVFQKHVDLEHVGRIVDQLGPNPDDEAIFRLCLPSAQLQPQFTEAQIGDSAFQFASPSNDFRPLGAWLLRPEQVITTGLPFEGREAAVVAVPVGFGANYLSVIHADNRLVLNNAYHRAYPLRSIGKTHIPAMGHSLARPEQFQLAAHEDMKKQPDVYFRAPRPPVLKDFFDPRLAKRLSVVRSNRQIRIGCQIEMVDSPAP